MAYKISKAKKIIEDLELEDGPVLHVEIDVEKIANDFNAAYNKVIVAEQNLQKLKADPGTRSTIPDVSIEKNYGDAIISLIKLIFGEENAVIILEYFEGHYIDMATEIYPFILDVIVPRIRQYSDEKRNKLANNYKAKQNLKFRKW